MTVEKETCDECEEQTDSNGHCSCTRPDWRYNCESCGESPVLPITGLCGPCTFGEADTIGGNW